MTPTPARRWTIRRWALLAAALLLVALALAPYVLSRSAWARQLVLSRTVDPRFQFDFDQLRLGWLSPVGIEGVRLSNNRGERLLNVDRLEAGIPWWRMLVARPESVHITVDRPEIPLILHPDGTNFSLGPAPVEDDGGSGFGESFGRRLPLLHVHVREARVTVTDASGVTEPLIPSLTMDLHLENSPTARTLTIDPVVILDRAQATRAMCQSGLQYIAPVLARPAWIEGHLSLKLDECRLNLDDPLKHRVAGQLSLHQVVVGPQHAVVLAVRDAVSEIADRDPITRIKIADESVVPFQLAEGRVHHSGLEFGLPEVAPELVVRSSGDVMLDRTIDLLLEIPLPFALAENWPRLKSLGNQRLNLKARGSLDDPRFSVEGNGSLVSDVISGVADPQNREELIDTIESAIDLIAERRARRRQQQEAAAEQGSDAETDADRNPNRGRIFRGRLGDRLRGALRD